MSAIKRLEIMRQDEMENADIALSSINGNPTPHHRNVDVLTEAIEALDKVGQFREYVDCYSERGYTAWYEEGVRDTKKDILKFIDSLDKSES
jgi:hypothetical protein